MAKNGSQMTVVVGGLVVLVVGVLVGMNLSGSSVAEDESMEDVVNEVMGGSTTGGAKPAGGTTGGANVGGSGTVKSTGAPSTAGTPKTSTTPTVTAPAPAPNTIRYTDSGFVPFTYEVKAGTAVTFINESGRTMWVKSSSKVNPFNSLDQGTSVGRGGTFVFTFTQTGTWGFVNGNYPSHNGAVAVMPQ